MSKSNVLSFATVDCVALDAVSGGEGETLGNAMSRYGERRNEQLSNFVFGEDTTGFDFGFIPTVALGVPVTLGLAAVSRLEGAVEGGVRWATGTTDYVDSNAPVANDAPAPEFQWSEQMP
jgi:hypothetical protein